MSQWVTTKGSALWPALNEPDTHFEEDGVYKVSLILSEADAEPLIEKLEKEFADGYAGFCREKKKQNLKEADRPWAQEMDQDENYTGNWVFRFKMKAKTGRGVEQRPQLFDARRNPMNEYIGNGSQIRVSFSPSTWFVPSLGVGMTLRLRGVQVLKLVEGGGSASPEAMGFDDEDGFETAAADFAKEDGNTSSDSTDF